MNTKLNKRLAKKLVQSLYTERIKDVTTAQNGTRNKVYIVRTEGRESDVVVRMSLEHTTLTNYLKEQWCINTAQENNLPVPEVLEVGNHIIPYPYFVAKFKRGGVGNKYTDKKKLYEEMGQLMKKIHTIKTSGFGEYFDWSNNQLSKFNTWKDYLSQIYDIENAIKIYKENNILDDKYLDEMKQTYNELKNMNFEPVLCHNDFLDKNILVNSSGKVVAILDWELAVSSHPFRDLGKTWRGIVYYSGEEMAEYFFKGYGMDKKDYIKNRNFMYVFDFISDCGPLLDHLSHRNYKEVGIIKKFWTDYFERREANDK